MWTTQNCVVVDLHGRLETPSGATNAIKRLAESVRGCRLQKLARYRYFVNMLMNEIS
jgi:hypothetical protein